MAEFEVLSPVGNIENFYIAVKSGADAVYLGLSKFNARMRANNINMDNLDEVVSFAHLKGVKVYVTLNTLVSTSEMQEVIQLVGKCMGVGVDAFIVQDYGIIGVLKEVYPDVVLHGSTQLGVHNVRGARVAKRLGLSRVVLSREVTIEDIKCIKENVDIELEVFVQGAMCVCFSGNCYMSSLKFGASGNRGECKQLCRLPYNISDKSKSMSGYVLSPRDNCMISRLKELIDIGVTSFKIEGRLRRGGYVNIATRTYRNAIDNILNGRSNNESQMRSDLTQVFSRGEFVEGYFNGNNIIDTKHNNHLGRLIGNVVSCKKFKDIYRIEISTSECVNTGDGLKFINGNDEYSLGVGNIEHNGKNIVVFGKNYIQTGYKVFRTVNVLFEDFVEDKSRYRSLNLKVFAFSNQSIRVIFESGKYSSVIVGNVCQEAKNKPTVDSVIREQLSKLGDMNKVFQIDSIDIQMDNDIYIPLSELNSIRRDGIKQLIDEILLRKQIVTRELSKPVYNYATIEKLAIIDEDSDVNILAKEYGGFIYSPKVYSLDKLISFYKKYFNNLNLPLILNLPIIALHKDMGIIDSMVEYCKQNNIVLLANNIYALDYINEGAIVWAGSNMNVANEYACNTLTKVGVKEIVSTIERWCSGMQGTYKMCKGNRVLMTMAHCPYKTISLKDCNDGSCGYSGILNVKGEGQNYFIRRYKVSSCYFEVVDCVCENKSAKNMIDDCRRCCNV